MPLTRRGLLGGTAAGLAALTSCDSETPMAAPAFDPKDWASVRAQFALDPAVSHFAAFVFASSPAPVRAAIARHREGFDHNTVKYLHANEGEMHRAIHARAAGYLGGVPTEEICFTDSTTMGLGMIYSGLKLAAGDEILTTDHDFYATHEALRLRELRDGVKVKRVKLYDDPAAATVEEIVIRLLRAITPATKVVALTWVHSGTGVKMPIWQICRQINGRALVVVDGVHGFGAEDAGPRDLECDFLISGCHKWLFGPRGTGLVWGKGAAWDRFSPSIPTFQEYRPSATPGGYHAFEHQWALREAFEFHQAIGRDRVAKRVQELNTRLKQGLAAMNHVKLYTPMGADMSAGIVCCRIRDYRPAEAVGLLEQKGIYASATPYTPSYVRFGASIATLESDVDKALAAVRDL
jgi:selenocysteine lyase/cysteine desulfurase